MISEAYCNTESKHYKNYTKVQVTQRKPRRETQEWESGKKKRKHRKYNKMAHLSSKESIITLTVNGLNTATKRQRLIEYITEKHDLIGNSL